MITIYLNTLLKPLEKIQFCCTYNGFTFMGFKKYLTLLKKNNIDYTRQKQDIRYFKIEKQIALNFV